MQKGANTFNQTLSQEVIQAARSYHISFIRLAPDKFLSNQRDFLIGNADHYKGLVAEDLLALKQILDMCAEENMPVVLTMLSLPGSRWKQNNHNQDDLRIWKDQSFQKQAAKFWQDLALALRNHPAIVGYNILNEPHLERLYNSTETDLYKVNQEEVHQILFEFYHTVIRSIREVDQETPIILDSSTYADSKTFKTLKPHVEENILYSFHMYEPYEYTNYKINQGKFSYPGQINGKNWDKKELQAYMQDVAHFQKINNIPSNRILVGEFGGHRTSKGLAQYFKDLISIFKENGWHFAFYAFREDVWDGMDYELGDKKLPWSYWQALEKGEQPTLNRKEDYPVFKVLRQAIEPELE
ncbi:MAG: glycosyl hydrolase [Candidatus Amoebophilus sp. 36-38]|nr:MAG: glycosyl hydrolase [Candidatus Amoebophilus sp. 36-38]